MANPLNPTEPERLDRFEQQHLDKGGAPPPFRAGPAAQAAAEATIRNVEAAFGTPPGRPKTLWPLIAAIAVILLVIAFAGLG
jgi:hypothetical protein